MISLRISRNAPALFGIPISIDRSWLFIVALVTWTLSRGYFPSASPGLPAAGYWAMGVIAACLLFGCVLLHELGHSVMAKRYGIPVAGVTLFIFGGVAHIAEAPRRPAVELHIALAGPLVSVAIAALCVAVSDALTVDTPMQLAVFAIVRYLAAINTGILLFNLLPGFPLDGGRVLRAALWIWTGNFRRATRIASVMGSGLGLSLFGWGLWMLSQG
jgi:Zn-dependent protease